MKVFFVFRWKGAESISPQAKKKPLEEVKLETLGLDVAPRLKIQKVETPPTRAGGVKVETVEQLIDKLRNEAKVIQAFHCAKKCLHI